MDKRNYAIEEFDGREFRECQPRVSVARETIADEARLTCAVHGGRAITLIVYTPANIRTHEHVGLLHVWSTSHDFYRAMHVGLARYCYCKSSVRLSVCLSVTLTYRGHIGWTSSKLITRIISLGSSLLGATTSPI